MTAVIVKLEDDGSTSISGTYDGEPMEIQEIIDTLEFALEALNALRANGEPQ